MINKIELKAVLKNYLTVSERKEVEMILEKLMERRDVFAVRGFTPAGGRAMDYYLKKDKKRLDELITLAEARKMAKAMYRRDAEKVLKKTIREKLNSGELNRETLDDLIREGQEILRK